MGLKKSEKRLRSLLSSTMYPSRAVISSLCILPVILARRPDPYYIDPGTLGMVIQGLAGLAIGALATAVVFRRRVADWVRSKFRRSGKNRGEEDTESALPTETKNESGE
jgi:hypothetical protein